MARSKTKADELAGVLDAVTVDALDKLLVKLSRQWMRVYVNRQMLAKEEGVSTPPPPPPTVDNGDRPAVPQSPPQRPAASAQDEKREGGLIISELIRQYCTRPDSPYQKIRFTSRAGYNRNLSRIERDCGPRQLADLKKEDLRSFYDSWTAGGKLANGYSLVTQLRMLFAFGADALNDVECGRLSVVLRHMGFTQPKRQSGRLMVEHVHAIIAKAHEEGVHSIALAMAFQFGCKLRQNEVIGEWAPLTEPGDSDVTDGAQKWLRGLRWSEIDANLILRHSDLKEIDLKEIKLVMNALERIRSRPKSGPIIVDEETGKPYEAWVYRRLWRKIATAAGVPESVKSIMTGTLKAPSATEAAVQQAPDELALTTRH